MTNIKFNYLYRDGANYKNYNYVVFDNPSNIPLNELETLIRSKLIEETWFYVDQWKLPDLHFGRWDNEIDHTWHEFENIEFTEKEPNSLMGLQEFIALISKL